jgi:hypothetical protein
MKRLNLCIFAAWSLLATPPALHAVGDPCAPGNADAQGPGVRSPNQGAVRYAEGASNDGQNFGSFKADCVTAGYRNGDITSNEDPKFIRLGYASAKHMVWGPDGKNDKGIEESGKRAELSDLNWQDYLTRDEVGNLYNYWYGWSYLIPIDSKWPTKGNFFQFIGQWRYKNSEGAFPSVECSGKHIGGSGHHLTYRDGRMQFTLTPQDPACKSPQARVKTIEFDLGPAVKGKWMDFIVQAKWTPLPEGVLKIWIRRDQSAGYEKVVDYTGPTWIDKYYNEERVPKKMRGQIVGAPNWQIGLYASNDKPAEKSPRVIYSDELRCLRTLCPLSEGSEAWKQLDLAPFKSL